MSWMCPNCSTYNDDSDAKCIACDTPRPADIKVSGYSADGSSGSSDIKFVKAKEEKKPESAISTPKYESKPKSKSTIKYTPEPEEKMPLYVAEKKISDEYAKLTTPEPKKETPAPKKSTFTSVTKKTTTTTTSTAPEMKPVPGKIFDVVMDDDTDQFLDSIGYNVWFWGTRAFYALIVITIVVGFFTHGGVWYFGQTVIPGFKAVFSHMGINWSHMHDVWAAMREVAGSNIGSFLNR